MKSNHWPNAMIAGAVILTSLVLLAALAYAIAGFQWSESGRTLVIDFQDITGIKRHTPVRYAGARIGQVQQVRYLTADERATAPSPKYAVRAIVALEESAPQLTQDVTATVGAETLLGERFIALVPGNPQAAKLPDGARIYAEFADPIAEAGELLNRIREDYPTLIAPLAQALQRVDGILIQSSNLIAKLDTATIDAGATLQQVRQDYESSVSPQLTAILHQGSNLGTNLNVTVGQAHDVVAEGKDVVRIVETLLRQNADSVSNSLSEVRVVSQNLKVVTTYLKALTGQLAERPSRLIWGRKTYELPSEESILQNPEPIVLEPPPK